MPGGDGALPTGSSSESYVPAMSFFSLVARFAICTRVLVPQRGGMSLTT